MVEKKKAEEPKKTETKAAEKKADTKAVEKGIHEKKEVTEHVHEKAEHQHEEAHAKDETKEHAHEHKDSKPEKDDKSKKADKESKKKEKVDIVSETIYTIPLRFVYRKHPSYKRSQKAVTFLVDFLKKHTKSSDIKVDISLNKHIWAHGDSKPPRSVQVKATKDSKGVVTATLLK